MLKIRLVQPGQRSYARRVKPEDWELHREKLTKLHARGVPRHVIIDTLSREDNFHPSTAQLNARFVKWGLRCYDKPPLFQLIQQCTDNIEGEAVPTTSDISADHLQSHHSIDRRDVVVENPRPTSKILNTIDDNPSLLTERRSSTSEYICTKNVPEAVNLQVNEATDRGKRQPDCPPNLHFFDPALMRSLRLPNQIEIASQVLKCIDTYLLSLLEESHRSRAIIYDVDDTSENPTQLYETHDEIARSHAEIFNAYDDGFQSLQLGLHTKGHLQLNTAGNMILKMLAYPSIWLLISVLNITTRLNWNAIPQHRRIVFAFLAEICRERLGVLHPFTIMTQLFCDSNVTSSGPWHLSFWACLTHHIDRLSGHAGWSRRNHLLKFEANEAYVKLLRRQGLLGSALMCATNLNQHYSSLYGPESDLASWSKYEVARTQNDLNNSETALKLFSEISERTGDEKLRVAQ